MKQTFVAIGTGALIVIVYITLHLWVSERRVEELVKLGMGAIYQSFGPEPPPLLFVDEALVNPENGGRARLVRLQGAAMAVERRGSSTSFLLERHGSAVRVSYTGPLPATFTEGGTVVVTGTLDGERRLEATGIAASIGRLP
jgi:cytochrome c-type biogenesis protein CcmE